MCGGGLASLGVAGGGAGVFDLSAPGKCVNMTFLVIMLLLFSLLLEYRNECHIMIHTFSRYVCMHMHTYVCTCRCICLCMYVLVYINIYTHRTTYHP